MTMNENRFTNKVRQILAEAQSLALAQDNSYIEALHVLNILLKDDESIALLSQANINIPLLKQETQDLLNHLPKVSGTGGEINISRELVNILNLMDKYATQRKDQYIAAELFFPAALEAKQQTGELLKKYGATIEALENAINQVRGNQQVNSEDAENQRDALKKYTVDLTQKAKDGKMIL